MAVIFNINTNNNNFNQVQRFSIEGNEHLLTTYFNSRKMEGDEQGAGSWYINLSDINNNVIISGINLVPFRDIFSLSTLRSIFTGTLVVLDNDGVVDNQMTAYNYGDGKRYQLVYLTEDEVEAL